MGFPAHPASLRLHKAKTLMSLLSRCIAFAIVLWGVSTLAADSIFIGSQSCNSVSCHGRLEPRRVASGNGGAGLQEFLLYERHDPHAKAAKTLVGPEFEAIIERLTEQNSSARVEVHRRCSQCHDPEGMASGTQSENNVAHGISCETCHGGAKDWLTRHYERDVSRSELVAAGMRDTKNLKVRAELCASCHVGSAEQDVNHDLLAAGHPPLRFELAAYHRQLTSHDSSGKRSHWNDARERIAATDFEVKLWEAGQMASARAALALLESRAHRAVLAAADEQQTGAPWPEFAEYSCFSCHQRLRGDEKSGGLPEWGQWNFVWLESSAKPKELIALREEMKKSFVGDSGIIKTKTNAARQVLAPSLFSEPATSSRLLPLLVQPTKETRSWDVLCQRYLAQRVLEKAIGDEFQKGQLAGQIAVQDGLKFNMERVAVDRDLSAIARELAFTDNHSERPKLLANPQGFEQVESALAATADKLRKLHSHVESGR